MQDNYTTKNKHLTIDERRHIERWKKEGKSNRKIAELLNRAPQTINNEINRGTIVQQVKKGKFKKIYKADYAQYNYELNRKRCVRKNKIAKEVIEKVIHYLEQKYSPEMIVKTKNVPISIRTIYYWMYKGKHGLSTKFIMYKHKKKAKKQAASPNYIRYGKSINERPDYINNRTEYGHYEIDTVILTKKTKECLLTLTDRKTRYQIIRLLPSKTAESVNNALIEILSTYNIKSITADNGVEFARLSSVFNYENIYYAHPYCSYERGSNENHNRLIRRWLPKGSTKTTPTEVAFIERWINSYPKRMFDYNTPLSFFTG